MSKNDELENEEIEVEEQEEETTSKGTPSNDFKNVVITECNRIIDQYIEICKGNNDEAFIKALENSDKTKENCVNHIMNNLTKKRIYGGADSLMYEFIHEYYVDNFTEVKDNWSMYLRGASNTTTKKKKEETSENAADTPKVDVEAIKKEAIKEYKEQEAKKKEEAKAKAEAEKEAKRKALEETKKKEEEEANQNLGGLFDLL